jgi:NAD(P)H-flavin reductase
VGKGDVLRLGPPLGHIAFDTESDRDLLLVAGGTGLAPLKAVVDQVARYGPPRRVDLFVGSRTEERIYDRADLERLDREHGWLTVTFAVSHDDLSSLEQGDIGEVVARYGPWTSRDVYAAGPALMVEDTTARLIGSGVHPERIRSEVFAPSRLSPSLDGEVTE